MTRLITDANDRQQAYSLKRQQNCNYYASGGGIGTFVYVVNANNVPIINTAVIIISKANLDKGFSPSPVATNYVRFLAQGDSCLPGMILGTRLGGKGNDLMNIFPISSSMKTMYDAFESKIYDCLANDNAASVTLRWTFYYVLTTDTKPYKVLYHASFHEGKGPCFTSISQSIVN